MSSFSPASGEFFIRYSISGCQPILIAFCICLIVFVFAYPLFKMLSSGSLNQIYLAMGIFTLIFSVYLPCAFVTMIEAFAVEMRFTALSFGFNMGLAIFGGTCPLIATWLIEMTGNASSPAFYIMLAALAGVLTSLFIQDKR